MADPVNFVKKVSSCTMENIDKTFRELEAMEGIGNEAQKAENPTLAGVKIGTCIGSGIGAVYGGIIGGAIGAAAKYRKTAAAIITAAVVWKFRGEIVDFISGTTSGDNAGMDAFM